MMAVFLDQLREVAEAKEREEADYRRESRRQLERLESERTRAFRRYNLLKDMVAAVRPEVTESVAAQVAVAAAESGWGEGREGYAEVHDWLQDLAALIHVQSQLSLASEGDPSEVTAALTTFEAWHRERFGQDFLDLLGRPTPSFQPLVDF